MNVSTERLQVLRAAVLVKNMYQFKQHVDQESLEPLRLKGLVPMCMAQYDRMFGTCRVPGREFDVLKHSQTSKPTLAQKTTSKRNWRKTSLKTLTSARIQAAQRRRSCRPAARDSRPRAASHAPPHTMDPIFDALGRYVLAALVSHRLHSCALVVRTTDGTCCWRLGDPHRCCLLPLFHR